MGAEVSETLPYCCGGTNSTTENEINTESQNKSMHKHIKLVKELDNKRSNNNLNISDYIESNNNNNYQNNNANKDNKAIIVYIYFMMILDLIRGMNGLISANPNTLSSNKDKFTSNIDPFNCVYKKWNELNDEQKEQSVDEVMLFVFILEGKDIEQKFGDGKGIMDIINNHNDSTDDSVLTKSGIHELTKIWNKLNYLEKKSYSLKFIMFTIDYIDDFEANDPITYYQKKAIKMKTRGTKSRNSFTRRTSQTFENLLNQTQR